MASLNTLKTKFGFLISGLIAVVLVIFALNLDSNTFVNQPTEDEINGPTVFTIADQEVKHIEYARLRDLYSQLQTLGYTGITTIGHEQGASMAFQTLMFNRFIAPAFENIGVYASEAELESYITAQYADLRAQYAQAGYPAEQIDMILAVKWGTDMYFAAQQLANQKFIDILSAGNYLNKLDVAKALRNDKLTFDGSYVEIPYTAIADKDVEVSDEEIKAYYEANRKANAKYNSRTIRYVRFDRQATEDDKKAIEAEVMALDAKVAAAAGNSDAIKSAVRSAGGKVLSHYTAFDALQKEVADAFKAGKGYGPEVKNNVWTARYLISDITAPESFEVEVATYADLAAAEKAVEELKANGGDFKKLQEVSDVNAQTISFVQMPVSDTKHFIGRKAGDIFAFNTSGMSTVVKINKVGDVKRFVLTANLDREIMPSDDTNRAVLAKVNEFSAQMGETNETFSEAAQAVSATPMVAIVARPDLFGNAQPNVQGIANSSNMARWAAGAKVGETKQFVIDGVTYVAMVISVDAEEFEPMNEAAIRRKIAQDKKFALLAEKANTLEAAKAFEGAKAETFAGAKYADNNLDGHLIGAIAATTELNKVQVVKGDRAVYVFSVSKINGEVDPATYAEERIPLTDKSKAMYENGLYMSFLKKAEAKDHRDDTTF